MAEARNSSGNSARMQQIIEKLARENDASVDHVRRLFERQHADLIADARVTTYISVIATRLVRNALIAERSDDPG